MCCVALGDAAGGVAEEHHDAVLPDLNCAGPPDPGACDPLTLYAPVGPVPDQPITDEALDQAYTLFEAVYGDQPKVMERAARALAIIRQPAGWRVPAPGVLHLHSSRPARSAASDESVWYAVRDVPIGADADVADTLRECMQHRCDAHGRELHPPRPCPDHTYRPLVNGNQCKHIIARELLRLAQALTSQSTPATSAPNGASVTLGGRLLGLALGIVYLSEQSVTFAISARQLHLTSGAAPAHHLVLDCVSGLGACAISLTAHALGALWQAFRPVATATPALYLAIDPDVGQLVLAGGAWYAEASGEIVQHMNASQ